MSYYLTGSGGSLTLGLPLDGLTGQLLAKASDLDFDLQWVNPSAGTGGAGSGTVTSVSLAAPTGFSVSGSPITGSGTLTLTFAAGYALPTTASQANWDTAFSERRQWDGSATGLVAATGRTSLGLGSLATQSGTFSGTSSGTNTGDQDLSGLVVKANNLSDLASAATARTNLGLGSAATTASSDFLPTIFTAGTITYGATVDLDMAALAGGYRTMSLTGNITFTTSNRASGRQVTLRLVCDATQRTLTFPAGWVFVGTKPSTIAASKTAVLSLTFFGTADTDCVAAYGVQA